LLPLPRYSPELNPMENVWEYLIPTGRTVDSNVNRCDAARCASPSLAGNGDGDDGSDHTVGAPGD
jgi:hypothetical protein